MALYIGLCPSKKHKKTGSGVSTTSSTTPAATSAPSAISVAAMVNPQPSTPASVLSFPPTFSSLVTHTNTQDVQPRFSSPLSPAFLEALAHDQKLREEKCIQEARRIDDERKVRQTVKVFAWSLHGREPVVAHIQAGFVWPFFNISYFVLDCVGLGGLGDKKYLEYFNDDAYVGYWTRLEVGHIFEVREGHSIFLKTSDVTNCPGFKDHLAHFRSMAPIFYSQLAREREYVRSNMTYDIWGIPSTPKKRKASSSPDISSTSSSSTSPTPHVSSSPTIIELKPKSRPPLASVLQPTTSSSSGSAADPVPLTEGDQCSTEWPRDYYVCDIVSCFQDCKTSIKRGGKNTRTRKVVFAEHFPGVTFKPSTYYDQRNFWLKASESLKKKFYEAGHVETAKWSVFTAAVRKQSASVQSTNTVIDLCD